MCSNGIYCLKVRNVAHNTSCKLDLFARMPQKTATEHYMERMVRPYVRKPKVDGLPLLLCKIQFIVVMG